MVTCYLDTSAFLKLYINEPGSAWLHAQMATGTMLASSWFMIIEVTSAFNRKLREGSISSAEYARLCDVFREDCRTSCQIVPLTTAIVALACRLLERHPLRSYDATHLATALIVAEALQRQGLATLIFVSADNRLNLAAAAEGLAVINPALAGS